MQLYYVAIQFTSTSLSFGSSYCAAHCTPASPNAVVAEGISIPLPERPTTPKIPVALISAIAMKLWSKQKGVRVHALTLGEINKAIVAKTTKDPWKNQSPLEYHEFFNLFNQR